MYFVRHKKGNQMINYCDCENEYQDKEYGKNKRVFNKTPKAHGQNLSVYRCTVCCSERAFSGTVH